MIIKTLLVACGFVTASFIAVGAVKQQEVATQEAPARTQIEQFGTRTTRYSTDSPSEGQVAMIRETRPFQYFGVTSVQRESDHKIAEAAKAVRQAKSEDQRSTAIDTLTKLLRDDYDDRLGGYDEYLNQLEEKLVEMRSKVQKRREARDEMIKLRIKVLEAEAEDLGWPERMSGRFPLRLVTEPAKVEWGTK